MDLSENKNYITYRYNLLMKEVSPYTPAFINPRHHQHFILGLKARWNLDKVERSIAKDMLSKLDLDENMYIDYYEVGRASFAF